MDTEIFHLLVQPQIASAEPDQSQELEIPSGSPMWIFGVQALGTVAEVSL